MVMHYFSEHRLFCFLVHPSLFAHPMEQRLASLAEDAGSPDKAAMNFDRPRQKAVDSWLPHRLKPAVARRYRNEPVFQELIEVRGLDLFLPIQRLFSGEVPARCRIYRLTDRARDLLNTGQSYEWDVPAEERFGHQPVLALTSSAAARIRTALGEKAELPATLPPVGDAEGKSRPVVPIQIHDVLVYRFSTDRVVCQVELEATGRDGSPVPPVLLAEMLHHCGRFSALAWKEMPPSKAPAQSDLEPRLIEIDQFTIGALVARLLFGGRGVVQRSFRTYTHAYAKVDPAGPALDPRQLRALGRRFARRYTGDYDFSETALGFRELSEFNNVQHVFSREGSATIVDPRTEGQPVEFLKSFLADAVEHTYLPIVVLNLHEVAEGLELDARSVLTAGDPGEIAGSQGSAVEEWSFLQRRLAVLKTRFRFRQVSSITMHNAFNRAIRECLELDDLEAELSNDLREMSDRVQAEAAIASTRQREEFRHRYRWVPVLGAAVAVGLLFLEFAGAVAAFSADGWSLIEKVVLCTAVAVLLAAGLFTKSKLDHDPD